MWTRLEFADSAPPTAPVERADVALFVGCATRRRDGAGRPLPLPASLPRWWDEAMGLRTEQQRPGQPPHEREALLNLPVPLAGWGDFEALFETDRPVLGAAGLRVATPMAAALRAFFASGGRRCHVVVVGPALPYADGGRPRFDSHPLLQPSAERVSLLPGLRPVTGGVVSISTAIGTHWAEWQGLEWAHGLPEVAMVLLPDLAEAFGLQPPEPSPEVRSGVPLEVFAACTPAAAEPPTTRLRLLPAPAHDEAGFTAWRRAVAHALALLRGPSPAVQRRDVQLIAALPLAEAPLATTLGLMPRRDAGGGARVDDWLAAWLATPADGDDTDGTDAHHDQLQLCWPWLRTIRSDDLPQLIEPPDGAFAGALAAQTLRAGAFRSVALQRAPGVIDTLPAWTEHDARQAVRWPGDPIDRPVREALTLCLPRRSGTRGGFEWASDRTSAQDPLQRIGALRRLLAQVMRHARRVGDDFAWEPSNEATWFRLRAALDALGQRIVRAGAVDDSRGDGWVVICDRRTMLDADLEAGRLIAQIHLRPALPIDRIVVTLTLRDGAALSFAKAA